MTSQSNIRALCANEPFLSPERVSGITSAVCTPVSLASILQHGGYDSVAHGPSFNSPNKFENSLLPTAPLSNVGPQTGAETQLPRTRPGGERTLAHQQERRNTAWCDLAHGRHAAFWILPVDYFSLILPLCDSPPRSLLDGIHKVSSLVKPSRPEALGHL